MPVLTLRIPPLGWCWERVLGTVRTMVPISASAGEGTSWRGSWEAVEADGREETLSLVWVRAALL